MPRGYPSNLCGIFITIVNLVPQRAILIAGLIQDADTPLGRYSAKVVTAEIWVGVYIVPRTGPGDTDAQLGLRC